MAQQPVATPAMPNPTVFASASASGHDVVDRVPQKVEIAVVICSTSRGTANPSWQKETPIGNLDGSQPSLLKFLLPSLLKTAELERYRYTLFIGVDANDRTLLDRKNEVVQAAKGVKVHMKAFPTRRQRIPWNEILSAAYAYGADYILRANDDTEFVSYGWTTLALQALQGHPIPNVGVVGPTCYQGKTSIMTHDMVHRTHMNIFNKTYYPAVFMSTYIDDWISAVYGEFHTTKLVMLSDRTTASHSLLSRGVWWGYTYVYSVRRCVWYKTG